MNNKKIYKKIKHKLKAIVDKQSLEYVARVICILILFNISKTKYLDNKKIKAAFKEIKFDRTKKIDKDSLDKYIKDFCINDLGFKKNEYNQFIDLKEMFDDLYKCSTKKVEIDYFFNQKEFDKSKNEQSVEYLNMLLKKLKTFNNKTISYLNYNYYLIIEFVRDSIEDFNYGH